MSSTETEPASARVAIFKNRSNQAIRIPQAMSFPDGVTELEATRVGDVITLRPPKKSWESFFGKWAGQLDEAETAYLEEFESSRPRGEHRPADFSWAGEGAEGSP
jgi:antitoxin VapB